MTAAAMLSRRQFLKTSGTGVSAAAVVTLAGCASGRGAVAPIANRRVVVIGGGWGGATAAKYVRLADPSIEVVLFEPGRKFVSCPFSNLVLSGVRAIGGLTFSYNGLRAYDVKLRHEAALAIEPDARRVRASDGYLGYDRLIVSPGVDSCWIRSRGWLPSRTGCCTPGRRGRRRSSSRASCARCPTAEASC